MVTHHKTAWVVGFALFFTITTQAENSAHPLTERGPLPIKVLRSKETTVRLLREAITYENFLVDKLGEAKNRDNDDEVDDIEDYLEIIRYQRQLLETAAKKATTNKDTLSLNAKSDRILRAVAQPIESHGLPPLPTLYRNIVWGGIIGQPAPGRPSDLNFNSEHESVFLYNKENDSFYTQEQLSLLSPEAISNFDVSPEHPFWYDEATLRSLHPDPVRSFENFLQRRLRNELHDDGDEPKTGAYTVDRARKVLFLEEIYQSATSPKGTAEDAFGVEWKIKWGDEAAIEPVAARLYLLAGGKMTDLTYSSGFGPENLVLVLPAQDEEDLEDDTERTPASLDTFSETLREFYGFDIEPYMEGHGVISPENVSQILRNLPRGGKNKYRPSELIGQHWLAFKESSLELKTRGFIRRLDGARMSDPVAIHDRAARGTYIFDMWIANRDVKNDNNKSYFIKRPRDGGMRITEFREGHHDLGLSLGSLWSAGEVNKLKVGENFANHGLFGKVRMKQAVLFRPESWNAATWADCRWMTRRILAIPEASIRDAVASSGWPDFMIEALTYRLLNRREQLAELFDLEFENTSSSPSLTWSLKNQAQITAIEHHYRLTPGSLAQSLQNSGAKFETVLSDGKISSAEDSHIVRLLTNQRYPSGLATRYRRKGDTQPKGLEY